MKITHVNTYGLRIWQNRILEREYSPLLPAAGLEVLSSLKMKGCQYITDVAMSHVSVVRGSLTELDISHCHGISAAGLHYLHCLRSATLECYLMCTAFELISMQSVQGISLVPMIDCGGKPGLTVLCALCCSQLTAEVEHAGHCLCVRSREDHGATAASTPKLPD